ncbi:MAG: T9SS type A sorting domain-containing protein [Bacteroidetes bacterium]|jgi:hypothetical protein|nr:T9SS type A sorting domain-containing protein [Bacteroidota bacterium]
MKRSLTILLFGLVSWSVAAQNWPLPCGTKTTRSAWLKDFQRSPQAHFRNLDTLLRVPLTIHLVGEDDGSSYMSISTLREAMCKLNQDFAEANLQFFIAGDIRYLPNSAYNRHESVLDGAEMMFANNVANTINIYFVNNPAGNCGYNLPYAGIAMQESCTGADNDTWAHEIGHALSVQHPFLGWEGGVSHDGSVDHNYNDPAPTTVTYDYTNFKDTLILDTTIIDTALVELVDGSNCQEAGDGFCDTSPDYLAGRWNCNADGESSILQTDPNGESFRSDGSLIMGYANDACQSRFTPEQIAAMRANLYEEKPEMISDVPPLPPVSEEPITLLYPIEDEVAPLEGALLDWEPVANATHYVVTVSILPTFNVNTQEYVTTNSSVELPELNINFTYYWKVEAYNAYSFCAPVSAVASFNVADITRVNTIAGLQRARLFPNPSAGGSAVSLQWDSDAPLRGTVELRHLSGQLLYQQPFERAAGRQLLRIPIQGLAAGLYVVVLRTGEGQLVKKLTVQR